MRPAGRSLCTARSAGRELVPRQNRIDPWGDLHAVAERGLFTGNRGCLVDHEGRLKRHHRGSLWIICVTTFRDWKHPLDAPRTWTPVFFLDDAVAMAAGHRPCGLCRREQYRHYQKAVTAGLQLAGRTEAAGLVLAPELNRRLASERLTAGRGLSRAADRPRWKATLASLPNGTVAIDPDRDGQAGLVQNGTLASFHFGGWREPKVLPPTTILRVLTPPTSVLALQHGFVPSLHPSAGQTR